MLTDRGTEFCGTQDRHEYELYLAVENIDHTRTKAKSPQTNGIVERFHKTMLDEFYRIAFRKKIYDTIEDLQADLDSWMPSTTRCGHTRANGATAKRRCRPSLTPRLWRARKADRRAGPGHHIGLIANGQFRPSGRVASLSQNTVPLRGVLRVELMLPMRVGPHHAQVVADRRAERRRRCERPPSSTCCNAALAAVSPWIWSSVDLSPQ